MATSKATPATPPSSGGGHHLKRDVGVIGLLFTAVGSIIGSGWLFGALEAAEQAGPASIISWVIGAIMILFIGLIYAELGTMFPISGGLVRFPHFAFGSFASYTTGWITWLGAASTAPIEVEAALQYANNYLPWLQHLQNGTAVLTTAGFFVAVGLMLLFSIINVFGIRWFARLNNALVWWKLGIITVVILALLFSYFDMSHFTAPIPNHKGGFLPLGWRGVFSSIATAGIVFSYLGFRQGVSLAGETKNPARNVPIAVIGSLLITALIYVALQVAFIGALPTDALANGWANIGTSFGSHLTSEVAAFGPLASLATTLGLTWLALLLYVDAFISPADTGLIYTTVTSRLSYAMGRNGNAPRGLAKVSTRGVPWVSVILSFIVGVIFFLPFPGWAQLVGFVTSATVLSFGSGPVTFLALRKQLPNQNRPFRLGGGLIFPFLAFLSSNLIVYWAGWDIVWKLMLAVVLGFIVLGIHELFYHRHTPRLDFRSGFWVLPWLGGEALISWLGSYPVVSAGAGNTGVLGPDTSIIVLALFSAFILWLAYAMRLPVDRAEAHVAEGYEEAAQEAETMHEMEI
ncbi:MAG TPA: APC family permease [Gammaproteobacteria bacterium]|nr:APC family permease [Gammaproteobacteria bacterium]